MNNKTQKIKLRKNFQRAHTFQRNASVPYLNIKKNEYKAKIFRMTVLKKNPQNMFEIHTHTHTHTHTPCRVSFHFQSHSVVNR